MTGLSPAGNGTGLAPVYHVPVPYLVFVGRIQSGGGHARRRRGRSRAAPWPEAAARGAASGYGASAPRCHMAAVRPSRPGAGTSTGDSATATGRRRAGARRTGPEDMPVACPRARRRTSPRTGESAAVRARTDAAASGRVAGNTRSGDPDSTVGYADRSGAASVPLILFPLFWPGPTRKRRPGQETADI